MEPATTIPQKLFFRIGEVCDLIKVQPHVLRYWETEFPMLSPQKNRAGQRVYRRKDVEMVLRIRNLLYEEKFTIAGARKKISEELRKSSPTRSKANPRELTPEIEVAVESREEEIFVDDETHQSQAASVISTPQTNGIPTQSITSEVDAPVSALGSEPLSSVKTQRAIRVLRHNLEELLTLLKADVSIKNPTG
jgi:DNA-binding transcriptional MerR regulator